MSIERKLYYQNYDMDATTFKYGRFHGPNPGYGLAKSNAGASITVNAAALGVGTFSGIPVGSLIRFRTGESVFAKRKIVTPGSDSVVVDTAIDLGTAGVPFHFWTWNIGATAADGWHYVHSFRRPYNILIEPTTIAAAGGVDVQIEGLGEHEAAPVILVPLFNIAAAAATLAKTVNEQVLKIRVGVKGNGGFAGTDDLTIALEGETRGAS